MFSKEKNEIRLGTHNGIFHTDEVIAITILKIVYEDFKTTIIRSRDINKLNTCDVVVDVGGGDLDHHMRGFNRCRKNGILYASAGLTWEKYGKDVITKLNSKLKKIEVNNIFNLIDDDIIIPIDNNDNGISGIHRFSFVENMVPVWNNKLDFDNSFFETVEICEKILRKIICEYISKELVKGDFYERVYNHIAEIPNQIYPWIDEAISYNDNNIEKVYFVIFPYPDGGWAAQCVPPKEDKMGQLKPFPKSWSGLTGSNLEDKSGIKGAILCHNFSFFAKAQSKEAILEMCKVAIKE